MKLGAKFKSKSFKLDRCLTHIAALRFTQSCNSSQCSSGPSHNALQCYIDALSLPLNLYYMHPVVCRTIALIGRLHNNNIHKKDVDVKHEVILADLISDF
jgi:hypothetical protein